ncbi:MAG: hypothetical protein J2P23_11355 [Microlunatus sp.]|nr:hypothetical protein [Microlunatus sp.]
MAPEPTVTLTIAPEVDGPPARWAADLLERQTGGSGDSTRAAPDPRRPRLAVEVVAGDVGPQGYAFQATGDRLVITATDAVGASYGLIGLVDQLRSTGDPAAAFAAVDGRTAAAAMPVRGIMRSFSSVDEDLPWFTSRAFWTDYLDWLAQARFSRFQLALGMQYNYGADRNGATDNYLCFAYPFLVDVPGWEVRAEGVSDHERRTNLEMLRFIAAETKRRGMDFQLGLWNHAYDYGRNSAHRFPITGLTTETHAEYCAAAITELLRQCPDIDGFTFRVHYEGGIPDEGHERFWSAIFDALSATGRQLQVDMHAKGVDDNLLGAVDKPGLRPVLSAKYWAEHQGLPYHQASIRRLEEAKPVPPGHELTAVTEFSRRFTRYGYADFLATDRRADVMFRIWPGTQKLLLWGDPVLAAGYGRMATFAGAIGVDVCEPLYFKGRKGSGVPGRRDPYIAPDLRLGLADWTKYAYTYRLWGRKLYNPDAPADEWQGYLHETYGEFAEAVEHALAPLSRILPLVTVVHGVGGSNNGNWPEMYTSLPVTQGGPPAHYGQDTVQPPMWGTVSPFDPTTFYVINEWATDALAGRLDGRYTPLEVADWIDGFVDQAAEHVDKLRSADDPSPQLRRTAIDAAILSGLGRFFASRFRSAADYAIYQQTEDRRRLESALAANRRARDAWIELVDASEGVYQANLRFGPERNEHGSWADRLPGIEADVDAMAAELRSRSDDSGQEIKIIAPERPVTTGVQHQPPASFVPGDELALTVTGNDQVAAVRLRYRHVNQAEQWQSVDLVPKAGAFTGSIPADYTNSNYPLMYFLTVEHTDGGIALHPGLEPDLANQPYYLIMPAR